MAIDGTIPLQYRGFQMEPQSNALARMMQLEQAQQQNALAKMQMSEYQRKAQEAAVAQAERLAQQQQQANYLGGLNANAGPARPFNVAEAMMNRIPVESIKLLNESLNPVRKVARVVEIKGPDGRPYSVQMDEQGKPVGENLPKWVAPHFAALGDRVQAIDPTAVAPNQAFPMGQSPDNKASVSASLTNAAATRDVAQATRDAARIQTQFGNEAGLRKEFEGLPEVKAYKQAFPAYAAIKDAASRNTTASDINIVYGIAKLYDPTSVVREGEYATVANSPNIPEKIKGYAQYLAGGGKLTAQVKAGLVAEAEGRIKTYEAEAVKARSTYEGIAKAQGIRPESVFPAMGALQTGGARKYNPATGRIE